MSKATVGYGQAMILSILVLIRRSERKCDYRQPQRERERTTIITAHRPWVLLSVDLILVAKWSNYRWAVWTANFGWRYPYQSQQLMKGEGKNKRTYWSAMSYLTWTLTFWRFSPGDGRKMSYPRDFPLSTSISIAITSLAVLLVCLVSSYKLWFGNRQSSLCARVFIVGYSGCLANGELRALTNARLSFLVDQRAISDSFRVLSFIS